MTNNFLKLSLFLFLLAGCSKQPGPPPAPTLSETENKFKKICQSEYNIDPILFPLQNTLWIYLPVEFSLVQIKASADSFEGETPKKEHYSVRFIEAELNDQDFFVQYDIGKEKVYPQNLGYETPLSDDYNEALMNIFTAISRTYFDMDAESSQKPPEFFGVIVADIKNGLEIKTVFYLKDFKRRMIDEFPHEEFLQRIITDIKGDQAIIGDTEGAHLKIEDVSWEYFLAEQIKARVKFKYQQSMFAPGEDTEGEILNIIAQTADAYDFGELKEIKLENLDTAKSFIFNQSHLAIYRDQPKTIQIFPFSF